MKSATRLTPDVSLSLASILIGTLIGTMSNSMVSIALPALMDHFQVPITSAVWSLTVYTLTFSVFISICGVIGPSVGYKRMFLTGMVITMISSIACVLTTNFTLFLVFRFMLGIGTGTILPTIMGIIAQQVPAELQGRATGYWALVNAVGHAIGPSLGGLLIQSFGWQSIFLMNVPLAILSFGLTSHFMRPIPVVKTRRFDLAGAVALVLLVFCALFAITFAAQLGLSSLITVTTLSGAILSFVFLLWYEPRSENPFVNLSLFKNRAYLSSILPISLQAFTQFGLLVSLPFFLIEVNRVDSRLAGLIIMSMTLIMAITSPFAGRLTDQYGSRAISRTGVLFVLAATLPFFALRFFPLQGATWGLFIVGLVLFGLGFGLIQSSATVAVLHAVPKALTSAASGFFHMLRFISGALGSTVIGIILEITSGGISGGFFMSFWIILIPALIVLPLLRHMPARQENVYPQP